MSHDKILNFNFSIGFISFTNRNCWFDIKHGCIRKFIILFRTKIILISKTLKKFNKLNNYWHQRLTFNDHEYLVWLFRIWKMNHAMRHIKIMIAQENFIYVWTFSRKISRFGVKIYSISRRFVIDIFVKW